MKKIIMVVALLVIAFTAGTQNSHASQEKKPKKDNIARDTYMIQSIDADGWATAKLVSDVATGEAHFYVKKNFSLGDFISVTYNMKTGKVYKYNEVNDDVRTAIMNVDGYKPVIKKIMSEGKQTKNLVMAEDGTFVAPSFHK